VSEHTTRWLLVLVLQNYAWHAGHITTEEYVEQAQILEHRIWGKGAATTA
jgi:hypothetical protein